jgi:hypothetical protein
MIRLLVIAALVCVAVRWATGAWPWQWLSTGPSRTRELAKARRLLQLPASASHDEIRAAYRRLAAEMHPDRGGSDAHLAALNAARDLLLAQLPENRR